MTNFLFLDRAFEIIEFLVGLPLIACVLYSIIKNTIYYIKEGDVRVVFILQSLAYIAVVLIESVLYMIFGCANDFCIISFKVFVFVNCFLYSQTKFTGKAAIRLSRMTRTILFLSCLTLFWATTFFFAMTTDTTYVFLFKLSPFEKYSQIVSFLARSMNGDFTPLSYGICTVPPFIFILLALFVDYMEDKPFKAKGNTWQLIIPAIINAYLVYPYSHGGRVLDVSLLLVMVAITTMCILREGYIISYYNDMTTPEMLAHKLYKELKKEKNPQVILMKQSIMMKMFSFREVEGFKNKRLQRFIQSLQSPELEPADQTPRL